MSDNSAVFGAIKSNECNRINEFCNSPWVVGISKSHPGQKYYFNTITGVSLWNINSEEMEKFLLQRPNGKQISHQNTNFPEPNEPPPNRRSLINHLQTSSQCSKVVSNGFPIHSTVVPCKACCSPVNQLLNLRQKGGEPERSLLLNNTLPQSQAPLTPTAPLTILYQENNSCCGKLKNLPERITCCNGENLDIIDKDTNHHEDMVHNQSNNDGQWFEARTHVDVLDVSPLKVLAKSSCVDDKWYIVADVSVHLQSLQFLRTVINSDPLCCLMVPQYVKVELENATKTHLKTKAYCANYFIHKSIDDGIAEIDEDSNLQLNRDKITKENLIDCCIKLTNQNYFVILVTDDVQLKKYRLKIDVPVFTVKELKDYLCRSSFLVTSPSPEALINCNKTNVNVPCATSFNTSGYDRILPSRRNSTAVKRDQNLQISLIPNSTIEYVCKKCASKTTVEAGIQTDLSLAQLEKIENVYKRTHSIVDNDNRVKEKKSSLGQSHKALLCSTNRSPRKHIKLRRTKVYSQPVSIDSVSSSSTQNNVNTIKACSSGNNLLVTNDLAEVNQSLQNTLLASMCDKNETLIGDKRENMSNCFLESHLAESVFCKSKTNYNGTCILNEIINDTILEKANIERESSPKQIHRPITPCDEKNECVEDKNVMFEVNNAVMEENLKRKSDEWVSRFVQIMEEALTQILSKASSLCLPPPWNMYEATVCIGHRYNDDVDVSDASQKFLRVLNSISDVKGCFSKVNISPNKFMEMYSYGVYLIDALQGIFNTCTDLQIAASSLTRLLNDIQNPDLDLNNIESFQDMSQEDRILNNNENSNNKIESLIDTENSTNIRQTMNTESPANVVEKTGHNNNLTELFNKASPGKSKRTEITSHSLEDLNKMDNAINKLNQSSKDSIQGNSDINTATCTDKSTRSPSKKSVTSPSSYSLRSLNWRKTINRQEETNVDKKLTSKKSLFLANLLLQESRDSTGSCEYEDIATNVSNDIIPSNNVGSSENVNNYNSNSLTNINETSNEPRIIRNFVVCSEFENRLRNTQIQDQFDDYDIDDDEMEVDYNDIDEFSSNKSKVDVAEFTELHNQSIYHPVRQDGPCNKDDVVIYFTCFIERIAQEIKDVSSTIYNFSTNYCDAISSVTNAVNKSDLREKAEQTYLHVDKVCTALNRILRRDKDFNYNLKNVLHKTEFGNFYVDEDHMDVYGVFIESSLKKVYDLKRIIEDILSALED